MGFGIGYGAEDYAKTSGAVLVIKSEAGGGSVDFPAFLTDFTQTFSSEWATERVFGRNDPIATFQGTKRTISLAWDIPSATLADAKQNLKKCGDLSQFLYPGYMSILPPLPKKKGNKVMTAQEKKKAAAAQIALKKKQSLSASIMSKPPLVRVTFANLISTDSPVKKQSGKKTEAQKAKDNNETKKVDTTDPKKDKDTKEVKQALAATGLLGYIDSLTWKPVLEMGMFSDGQSFYPKVVSLNFNLNVLHEHFLGWSDGSWMGNRFPFKIG